MSNDILRVAVTRWRRDGARKWPAEGVKVLKAVAALEGIKYELKEFDFGGERYLRTGEILPPERV